MISLSRRAFGAVTAGAVATALLTACGGTSGGGTAGGGSGENLTEINFGYISDYNGASLLAVAEDQGLWAKHGIKANTKVFTNGPLQIQALGTGDIDFGYIGPGAMWLPASGQAKIVALNTLGNADRVIAQPGINSIQDLKGKTVGVPEGTSGDMILTLALEKAGVAKSDLKIVPMDQATIVSAFSSKQIDAAGIWYPAIGTIKQQVPELKELAKNEDFKNEVSFPTAFVAGNAVVTGKQDAAKSVVGALREAMDYRAANPEETVKMTAKLVGRDEKSVADDAKNSEAMTSAKLDELTKDGTVSKWLTGMNDYFVAAGKLPNPVDPADYYTADLFTGASK